MSVSVGRDFGVAVLQNGSAVVIGKINGVSYNPISFDCPIKMVSCGVRHVYFVLEDGRLFVMGDWSDGSVVVRNGIQSSATPMQVPPERFAFCRVMMVDSYSGDQGAVTIVLTHSHGRLSQNRVYIEGEEHRRVSRAYGGVGRIGELRPNSRPGEYFDRKQIVMVSAGEACMALADDGTVYVWGYHEFGVHTRGHSSQLIMIDPAVFSYQPIAFISNRAAITRSGLLYTWGSNTWGENGWGSHIVDYYQNLWVEEEGEMNFSRVDLHGASPKIASNPPSMPYTSKTYESNRARLYNTSIFPWGDHAVAHLVVRAGLRATFVISSDGRLWASGSGITAIDANKRLYDPRAGFPAAREFMEQHGFSPYFQEVVPGTFGVGGKKIVNVAASDYIALAATVDGSLYVWSELPDKSFSGPQALTLDASLIPALRDLTRMHAVEDMWPQIWSNYRDIFARQISEDVLGPIQHLEEGSGGINNILFGMNSVNSPYVLEPIEEKIGRRYDIDNTPVVERSPRPGLPYTWSKKARDKDTRQLNTILGRSEDGPSFQDRFQTARYCTCCNMVES
tara:strand:- start:29718 stop:31409 length:1692 start_codon:yes stop_codon:yes gene_type:complete